MTQKMTLQKICFLILLMGGILSVLTGCISNITEKSKSDPTAPSSIESTDFSGSNTMSSENKESNSAEASGVGETEAMGDINDHVVLIDYGGWNDETDVKNEDEEYVLSGEDAEIIVDLFYNHEKKVLDSPLSNVATLEFRINDDYLYSSMDALKYFSGRIEGEPVLINLTEDECETICRIITQYVGDALS